MAVTITNAATSVDNTARVEGNRRRRIATVTFDTAYPTGGYALTAASFNMNTLETVDAATLSQLGTHFCLWNQTTSKLQVFTALSTEVGNNVDIHTDSVVVEAIGN